MLNILFASYQFLGCIEDKFTKEEDKISNPESMPY